jgi:hypothetical protein
VAERLGHQGGGGLVVLLQCLLGQLQRDRRVDEPLLRAIVQIADHSPALVIGGGHDPRS